MKFNRLSRRHWLQGAGAALALPLLPSLLPRTARADTLGTKSFVGIPLWNGQYRLCGSDSQLMPSTNLSGTQLTGLQQVTPAGKYPIHHGSLSALAAANGGKISDVIDASYTPLLKKMFMLQGLDFFSMGAQHHRAHFGAQNKVQSPSDPAPAMASIDQVLGNFYKKKGLPSDVVLYSPTSRIDGDGHDWSTSWLADGSAPANHFSNPATLWEKYFGKVNLPPSTQTLLVDRVLEDYRRVRNSSRLGSEDRQRLEAHIAHLATAEAKVKQADAVCRQLRPAENSSNRRLILTALNDVVVGLISCGLCHVFMGFAPALLDPVHGMWHYYSHHGFNVNPADGAPSPSAYAWMIDQNRAVMNDLGLDLAKKLDAVGQLDNTIILTIQEHSRRGHETMNIPVIGFGSGGGAFATDKYVDYRDFTAGRTDMNGITCYGYPMNQLHANVLQAMGMTPSDYEPLNKPRSGWRSNVFKPGSGYGCESFHPDHELYGAALPNYYAKWFTGHDMSAKLPIART